MAARRFDGELDRARLPRLSAIAPPCRPLDVHIEFSRPAGTLQDVVRVAVRAAGRFEVTCQRCLEPMELDREVATEVLLVGDENVARQLERGAEVQISPPGELLDLAALVEDEVMLALPFAPRHEAGQCRPALAAERERDDAPAAAGDAGRADDARENPFAVLAALKRRHHED